MRSKTELTVLIPACGEELLIAKTLINLARFVKKQNYTSELLVIENGHRDKTFQIANGLTKTMPNLRVYSQAQANYGAALKRGIELARGNIITIVNVDFWLADFIVQSLKLVTTTADFVVGSKHLSQSGDKRNVMKIVYSQGFNVLLKILFGFKGTDTHGLKTMRRDKVLPLVAETTTSDFVFDTELVLRAQRHGLRMAELPVQVSEIRPTRYSAGVQLYKTIKNLAILIRSLGLRTT